MSAAPTAAAPVPQMALFRPLVLRWGVPGAAVATAGALLSASAARVAVFVRSEEASLADAALVRRADVATVVNFGREKLRAARGAVFRR